MTLNLSAPMNTELKPRIVVVGVGGAGGNAVNNMITAGLDGVEFVVANTDAQALTRSEAERRIQLGASITQGLGCGARPEVGRQAAEEAIDQIVDHLGGAHMAFITAGMGGGTGTGAAPVVARACREAGILTVGVVTKPFQFEGTQRARLADSGIEELQEFVDTLIVIPNQNLFRITNEKTTFAEAFRLADEVLHSGVRGITDLMVMPGLINLDFADVKTVMGEMGKAMMGTGQADGENRAVAAAEAAIANPLLDDVSMRGAQGVLINITGGNDLALLEVDAAAERIRSEVDPEANIIVGAALNDGLEGQIRVSVVATGIGAEEGAAHAPMPAPRLAAVSGQRIEASADAPAGADPLADEGVPVEAAPVAVTPAPVSASSAPTVADPAPAPAAQDVGAAMAAAPAPSMAATAEALPNPAPATPPEQAETPDVEVAETPAAVPVPEAAAESETPVEMRVPRPKSITRAEPEAPAVELERKPSLLDRADERRDVFIAPKPAAPQAAKPLGRPDPMREAEVMNADAGSRQPERPAQRGLGGLFSRMTGKRAETPAEPAPTAAPAPAPTLDAAVPPAPAAEASAAPREAVPVIAATPTVAPPPSASPTPPAEGENRLSLGTPDPQDRLTRVSQEEDLLEIPAFLRRQAN